MRENNNIKRIDELKDQLFDLRVGAYSAAQDERENDYLDYTNKIISTMVELEILGCYDFSNDDYHTA